MLAQGYEDGLKSAIIWRTSVGLLDVDSSSMCCFHNLKPKFFADSTFHFCVMSLDRVLFKRSIINEVSFAETAPVWSNT